MARAHRTLAYGPLTLALRSNDAAAADWLAEVLSPWFAPTDGAPDWIVRIASSREDHADLAARRPADAAPCACFALDQEVIALPAWATGNVVTLADAERSCFLTVGPGEVTLTGDPDTLRWRFTAMWVCQQLAATRLRRAHLDVHAAAVEASGRAVLIVGPKGAGKTTLSLQLLRSGRCRMMANDRAFVCREATAVLARGMPTAVKIRPTTLAEFPELWRGLPRVDRPYLRAMDDLAGLPAADAPPETEFALSPPQLARQLGVQARATAPLGAVVLPHVRSDAESWRLERLAPPAAGAALLANLYGGSTIGRGPTVFEALDGGVTPPSPDLAAAVAETVPAYRLVMAPRAYGAPAFTERVLAALLE